MLQGKITNVFSTSELKLLTWARENLENLWNPTTDHFSKFKPMTSDLRNQLGQKVLINSTTLDITINRWSVQRPGL